MNTINTPRDWSARGEKDDRPDMPPLAPRPTMTAMTTAGPALATLHAMHAICLEVADRAQAVAWHAYVQDRRPNAGIAAGLGVLAAYLRLGDAVEALLNALADAERPAERPAERRGPR